MIASPSINVNKEFSLGRPTASARLIHAFLSQTLTICYTMTL